MGLWGGASLGSWFATYKSRKGRTDHTIAELKRLQAEKGFATIHHGFYCFECQHELTVHDMRPILGYIRLHGKCRYCQKPIDPIHFKYELIGATIGVATYAGAMIPLLIKL